MANKTVNLNIAENVKKMQKQNNMGEYKKEEPILQNNEKVDERVETAKRSVGRQPKERKIKRDYPKTIYFDEATSMKLSDVRTKDKIEIKDLVLVATIDFLNKNYNEEARSLKESAKDYIQKEMSRILDEFGE